MTDELTLLRDELNALRARTAELELAREQALAGKRALRNYGLVAAGVVALLGSSAAIAANGNCPNGLPFCFAADTPAQASQVNHNFSQVKEWLEAKVGTVGTAVSATGAVSVSGTIRVQQGTTSNTGVASGKALFVSGPFGDGQSDNGGFEVRHDNLSQGVGIGFNTVYATGSNTDQPLFLKGRGASPVSVLGGLSVSTNLNVSGNTWGGRTSSGYIPYSNPTANGGTTTLCTDGQYMCGVTVGHISNDGNYWTGSQIAIHCCTL